MVESKLTDHVMLQNTLRTFFRSKLFPVLLIGLTFSVSLLALPTFGEEEDEDPPAMTNREMLSLYEARIDLSKPAEPGPQFFQWVIDTSGKPIANLDEYSGIMPYSQGLAAVYGNGKDAPQDNLNGRAGNGYIDQFGKLVIPIMFANSRNFSEGLAWVRAFNKENGYIERTGQQVIKNSNYYEGKPFSEGLAAVRVRMSPMEKDDGRIGGENLPGKWGYVDNKGTMTISPQFDVATGFHMGLAGVKVNKKWKFINSNGHEIGEQYDKVGSFSLGLAPVSARGKWGYLNKKGILQIPKRYEDAKDFSEELAAVKMNGKYGFINIHGEVKITPSFTEARGFSQGLCAVKTVSGRWIYIDKFGKQQFNSEFDEARSFTCERALVSIKDTIGYIDLAGKYAVEPQYDFGDSYSDERAVVRKKNWNHPINRMILMSLHMEGIKARLDKNSKTEVYIPKDLDDAIKELDTMLPEKAKHDFTLITEEELYAYHHGFGTWLRNNWGLWKGLRLAKYMNEYDIHHPDDMSHKILVAYWKKMHGLSYAMSKRKQGMN